MRVFKNKPAPGDLVFGLFRSPKNFLACAETIMHPIDFSCPLPDELIITLSRVLQLGPAGVIAHRAGRAKELVGLLKSMEADNAAFLDSLPATPKKILRGKRMALWKHLSEKYECPDVGIIDEIAQGCPLTGLGVHSKLFPAGFQPAQKPADHLKRQHVWLRHQVLGKCRSSGNLEVDQECWDQTLSEVKDGWMEGPFESASAVTQHLGSDTWLCSRRFPLVQGDKVRLIDDAKESQINTAYYATNKLALQDVDCLVSLVMQMCRCFVQRREFAMRLSDGSTVSGRVAPDWGPEVSFLGRTLDLSSAYKQLPTSDQEPWSRIIVVHCPVDNKPKFFVSLVLPFGCTASVYFFNRASKNLWWLFQKMFMVIGTTYYDDYPTVEPEATAGSARACQELLLTSLGWKFAKEGKKALDFSQVFDVLGISLDLSGCNKGNFSINNKASRVEKILSQVDQFVTRGSVTSAEAAQVHGILNFAQGQYLGRVLQPAMRFFQRISLQGWNASLKSELAQVATFLATALLCGPPRVLNISDALTPVLLFTDGACEPAGHGFEVGAGLVVRDPVTGLFRVHETPIAQEVIDTWAATGKNQVIAACELYPILIAWLHYGKVFHNRRVIVFIDNSSVKTAAAKGASKQVELFALLSLICLEQSRHPTLVWYTRVPSKSNCADGPSRQNAKSTALDLGAQLGEPLGLSGPLLQFLEGTLSYPVLMKKLAEVWNKGEGAATP